MADQNGWKPKNHSKGEFESTIRGKVTAIDNLISERTGWRRLYKDSSCGLTPAGVWDTERNKRERILQAEMLYEEEPTWDEYLGFVNKGPLSTKTKHCLASTAYLLKNGKISHRQPQSLDLETKAYVARIKRRSGSTLPPSKVPRKSMNPGETDFPCCTTGGSTEQNFNLFPTQDYRKGIPNEFL